MDKRIVGLVLSGALLAVPAQAAVTLDFEGTGDFASLLDFYNGGFDSSGAAGPNYRIAFGDNAYAMVAAGSGGSGDFANPPSGRSAAYLGGSGALVNVLDGFSGGFAVQYASLWSATLRLYDGLNGSGNLLATIVLEPQAEAGCGLTYCQWRLAQVGFEGVARSVDFGALPGFAAFDDMRFGVTQAVPEPGTYALLLAGLGALGGWPRWRGR